MIDLGKSSLTKHLSPRSTYSSVELPATFGGLYQQVEFAPLPTTKHLNDNRGEETGSILNAVLVQFND